MLHKGLCSISFRNLTVEEIVTLCRNNNIEYIEWGSDVHVPCGNIENAKYVASLCASNNIKIYSYGTYFKCDDVTSFEQYCIIGQVLGAKVLRIWCGEKGSALFDKEEYKNLIKLIKNCADIAKKYDLIIAFENHGKTLCDETPKILKMLIDVNKDNVKMYFQPDYWNIYSNDVERINTNLNTINILKKYLCCVHVYSWKGTDRLLLNDKHYEWEEYFKILKNVDLVCYLEFFKDDNVDNFIKDASELSTLIKEANEYKEQLLPKFSPFELSSIISDDYKKMINYSFTSVVSILSKPIQRNKKLAIVNQANIYKNETTYILNKEDWSQYQIDGERQSFEKKFFNKRNRLHVFVLAYLYNQDSSLIPYIEKEIKYILNDYSWVLPAHFDASYCIFDDIREHQYGVDLASSLTASCLAEISYILKDVLNESLILDIFNEIKKRIFNVFDRPYAWKQKYKTNNWAAVCASNVGIAAIYILNKEELLPLLSECIDLNNNYLETFKDDGACIEGVGYWNYGFGMFIVFADLLKQISQSKISYFAYPKVENISSFANAMILNNGYAVSFGDVDIKAKYFHGIMCKLHEFYPSIIPNNNLLIKDYKNVYPLKSVDWLIEFKDLIWEESIDDKSSIKNETFIYKDTGFYIKKINYGNFIIGVKIGHNFEPHNQLDVGSFVLFIGDEPILVDPGRSNYSKDYFDEGKRYSFFTCSSLAHNIPIIDDHVQEPGCENRSENVVMEQNSLSMELKKAYGEYNQLVSYKRRIDIDEDRGSFILSDSFAFKNGHHIIKEHFVSLEKPSINNNCLLFTTSNGVFCLSFENITNDIQIRKYLDTTTSNFQELYLIDITYEVIDKATTLIIKGNITV